METDIIRRDDDRSLKFNFEEFKDLIEDIFSECEDQTEIAGLEAAMQEAIEQIVSSILEYEYKGKDDEYLLSGFAFSFPDEEGFVTIEEIDDDENAYDDSAIIDTEVKNDDSETVWSEVKNVLPRTHHPRNPHEIEIINAKYID